MKTIRELAADIELYTRLMEEWKATPDAIHSVSEKTRIALQQALESLQSMETDPALKASEPDEYQQILERRPKVSQRMHEQIDAVQLKEKLTGAILCRFAGCILGAVVENWSIERMEKWASLLGDPFPPVDYWKQVYIPEEIRYFTSPLRTFSRTEMNGAPVDDDIAYTLLGLLIAEQYGLDFTVENVGEAWVKLLPKACTAEAIALRNLKEGVPARQAAEIGNPYCQWIGAAIRSDPWAYLAPGWPEKAAHMAYTDAYLTHRRNGIYGEMFLAAAQSAAFVTKDAETALRTGLEEIPSECELASHIRWALEASKNVENWRDARRMVDERFAGMSTVHTINNLCLVVFGLMMGGTDVTKVLGEIVAMGMDNDCTAASAGSILGALVGAHGIPAHWYEPFHDKVLSYLNGYRAFSISDVVNRFIAAGSCAQ